MKDADQHGALARVIEKIRLLQHKVGLPVDFSEYNISEQDLQRTIPAVAGDPAAISFPIPKELIHAIGRWSCWWGLNND